MRPDLKLPLTLEDFEQVSDRRWECRAYRPIFILRDIELGPDNDTYVPSPYYYHTFSSRSYGYNFSVEQALKSLNEHLKGE